jgi:hypothetical protein
MFFVGLSVANARSHRHGQNRLVLREILGVMLSARAIATASARVKIVD